MQKTLRSAQFLKDLWADYGLPEPLRWREVSGDTNVTWIVTLKDGQRIVLRRYHPAFDEPSVRFEQCIVRHLHKNNFPVSGILSQKNGTHSVHLENHWYALLEYKDGRVGLNFFLRKMRPQLVARAAELLSEFHRLMKTLPRDGEPDFPFTAGWCLEEIKRLRVFRNPQFNSFLSKAEDWLTQRIALLADSADLPRTVIHGDYGPHNLLFKGNQITAVLDFGNAHFNLRVHDVAQGLVSFSKGWGPRLDFSLARIFLKAYQNGNRLEKREISSLPSFMILWNLIPLCHQLGRSQESGSLKNFRKAVKSMKWVDWLWSRETEMKDFCENLS